MMFVTIIQLWTAISKIIRRPLEKPLADTGSGSYSPNMFMFSNLRLSIFE